MITVDAYRSRKIGVFGLGKSGEASVRALLAGGAEVWAWDDGEKGRVALTAPSPLAGEGRDGGLAEVGHGADAREDPHPNPPLSRGRGLVVARPAEWPWPELAALILSPGIPLTHPQPHAVVEQAKRHNVLVIGDVELLWQARPQAKYVGITGTNGKSTTTTLLGHILAQAGVSAQVGGNLGMPVLALEESDLYVLELSSYQLDLLQEARFNVAVWLNLTPDHLDRHGDMAGYAAAKRRIFARQGKGDVAIIALDDQPSIELAEKLKKEASGRTVTGISASSKIEGGISVEQGILHDGDLRFSLLHIPSLTGQHNWQNAAVAYAAARALGVPSDVIYAAIKTFPGLRHRMQLVAEGEGVRFVNDSKATNAEAAQHALKAYENIYWIAGGKPKAGGIESLASYFSKIRHAYLIGDAAGDFALTLESHVAYTCSGTLENAVIQASAQARQDGLPGAVVLLSPACASFDQFKSFERRGDVFCDLVENALNQMPGNAALSAGHKAS